MQKKENRGQPMALTSGSIKKQLVLFSIPIFLGTLLQQLYNVIDAVVAGRLVNEDALSAIGVSVPIYLLFVSVILGLVIGITILLAQFFGAKQFEQIKSLISTMSVFFIGFRFNNGVWWGNFSKAVVTDYPDSCRAFRACFGIFENGIFGYSVFNAV